MTTIAEAMRILKRANETNPEAVLRAEMHEVVKGVDLLSQRATPQPSFGGQSPINVDMLERQQRAHEQAQKLEVETRERSASRINAELEDLAAAQSPDNRAAILRQRQ